VVGIADWSGGDAIAYGQARRTNVRRKKKKSAEPVFTPDFTRPVPPRQRTPR
jgi:hypothetical protein